MPIDHDMVIPTTIPNSVMAALSANLSFLLEILPQNRRCAAGGSSVRAIMMDATRANVLVYASGLKSLPSAPIMANTGKKLTTVVSTAVKTAPPTSLAARWTTSNDDSSGEARSKCRRMFSHTTMPISTIVPMAMAMPDSATMLACTPNSFMPTKHNRTVRGSMPLTNALLRRCITITSTTMIVTSISSQMASLSVPNVS